jgi:hypothetical protein
MYRHRLEVDNYGSKPCSKIFVKNLENKNAEKAYVAEPAYAGAFA